LRVLGGNLTGTIHGDADDVWTVTALRVLAGQVGRLVYQGVPTGVAVVPAMHHGGPYPASSTSRDTSVGIDAVYRFLRPLAYQDFPPELLPESLRGTSSK
jgi:NADP-dependent aldehyde dehydrogenase